MDAIPFEVETRETSGKGAARQTRREGRIPGIIYGKNYAPRQVHLNPKDLQKQLDNPKHINTVFSLSFADGGDNVFAMIKELQRNPVTKKFLHVDFAVVSPDEAVAIDVPIELQGNSVGVKAGGKLEVLRRTLSIRCLPVAIPASIPIDITAMKIGSQLRIKDLKMDETLQAVYSDNFAIVRVKAGRDEAEDEEEEGGEEATSAESTETAES